MVARAGLGAGFAKALVAAASITDILLGALFLLPGWVRRAGTAQLVLSTIYLVGLSLLAPSLWTDHFGPLLKVVPMRNLQIERTLWQLKVPGRIEIPAATAFERMIWQDKRVAEVA